MPFLFLILAFVFLLVFPEASLEGARSGLLLWFEIVLPTLFPFLIVTNMMEALLPIKKVSFYAMFTGMLSGYPVGAKSIRFLLLSNRMTKKEGQFFLSFCNNASPAFLLNYVFLQCLGIHKQRFILLLVLYLSSFISSLMQYPHAQTALPLSVEEKKLSFDSILMTSIEVITKIGGYIILFSLLATILNTYIPLIVPLKILLCGSLEITTGMHLLGASTLPYALKLYLGMFLASFGGLCAHLQTYSMIKDTKLSIWIYLHLKLIAGILSVAFTYILFLFNIL